MVLVRDASKDQGPETAHYGREGNGGVSALLNLREKGVYISEGRCGFLLVLMCKFLRRLRNNSVH